jgi:hypothetical protein
MEELRFLKSFVFMQKKNFDVIEERIRCNRRNFFVMDETLFLWKNPLRLNFDFMGTLFSWN